MLDLFLNRFSFESLLKAPEQCLGVYFNRKPSPLSKNFDFASLRQSKKSVITDNELSHDLKTQAASSNISNYLDVHFCLFDIFQSKIQKTWFYFYFFKGDISAKCDSCVQQLSASFVIA